MISLSALNTYSTNTVSFTDNRTPDVKFNIPAPKDLAFTSLTQSFPLKRSIDIVDIIQPALAIVQFEIDVSALSGVVLSWPSIPSGVIVSNIAGVYTINGINTVSDWEAMRQPTITLPSYYGYFFYTCTIRYTREDGRQSKSWQVGTYIPEAQLDVSTYAIINPNRLRGTPEILIGVFSIDAEISYAGFSGSEETDWYASQENDITDAPLIAAEDEVNNWTVTITPSNTSIVTLITHTASVPGLSQSFNPTTKVKTYTGTKAQINQALATLRFTASSTRADFTFTYETEDPVSSVPYSRIQSARCMNLQYLNDARGTATYTTGIDSLIGTSLPNILDPDYTDEGTYTITVYPTATSQIANITSNGIIGWGVEQSFTHTASATGVFSEAAYGSSNNVIVLGNPNDDTNGTNAGAAHWLIKEDLEYSIVKNIFPSTNYGLYGAGIAMADDDTVIISQYGYADSSDPSGRVYVYERGSGNTWTLAQTLYTNSGTSSDQWFGYQLSCSRNGDVLAIARPTDTDDGAEGAVYIYTRTGTGNYSLLHSIADPDFDGENYTTSFGWNQCKISPDGTRLAITDGLGLTNTHDTYFYTIDASSYTLDEKLSNIERFVQWTSDGTRYLYEDNTTIYVMTRQSGGNYTQSASFTPSDTFTTMQLSVDDSTIIVRNGFEFTFIDFDESDNSFSEARTIDMTSFMSNITDWRISLDGLELIILGNLTGGANGFVTYTYGPKPGTMDPITKVYTITGTKDDVNGDIDTIEIKSTSGVISNIEINVHVVTPEDNEQTKSLTITNA